MPSSISDLHSQRWDHLEPALPFEQRSLQSSTEYNCEPTRYSVSKHMMAFFFQPHDVCCCPGGCWRMLSLLTVAFVTVFFQNTWCSRQKQNKLTLHYKETKKLHYKKTHTAHIEQTTAHIEQTTNELKKCWEVMCHTCPGALCAILAQNHPATVAEPWVALMASELGVGIDISVLHKLQKLNKCFRCLTSRTFLF